jgi:hypothetical protein
MTIEQPDMAPPREEFSKLIDARLTSVQFVLDYLILGFDQKGALTCLVWPEIIDGNISSRFGTEGYRDKLCSLIEKVVRRATMDVEETIWIEFESDALRIPLRSYEGKGERAILTGPNHYLLVL